MARLAAIHALNGLYKQDVDARDIWREDGASRLLPGHDESLRFLLIIAANHVGELTGPPPNSC